ncbi:2,5-diamino-6-(ribosylamino)-4(3H)-pyrimidinone 5'-phosphate reductase [Mycoblastus sanguinarius]|nr:2,5-diamino-6-(ribosylamino)-4(3H)-pyrimidinone 5'-phosphate reductase [Mycoblastus sanguinarius]
MPELAEDEPASHEESPSNGQVEGDPPSTHTPDRNPAAESQDQIPPPTRTLNDLLRPPPDLALMRQRLFEVKDKIELQVGEFERYWPYIDNVWVRQHKAGTDKSGRVITDYYACRLQRPTYTPKPTDTPRREGQPTRKKQIREGGTCQMRLKTIRYEGGYSGYTIMKVGDESQHTHDLDHIDKIKRTSVLMEIARSEVMKGYMPASVFTVMNEDMDKLVSAGGRYLNRNDVRNASQHWRQIHREELRVHEGYKYDHGNGIVRHDGAIRNSYPSRDTQIVDPALSNVAPLLPGTLRFPESSRAFLEPYLPPKNPAINDRGFPHVTLTYATSMDSCLSLAPGMQTQLSGPESKAMTHYLRSKHDAIVIGVGTATADDPGLNCRLEGVGGFGGLGWEGQPRPVIIDPGARWLITPQSKVLQAVQNGKGRGPWVIMAPGFAMDPMRLELLKYYGGKYLGLTEFDQKWRLRWEAILKALAAEGIKSVMIEGGGMVINDLLQPENANFISSVVITVAPTYLGKGGVGVSPARMHDQTGRPQPAMRFEEVKWQPLGEDVVMCGKLLVGKQGPAMQAQTSYVPGTQYGTLPS